MNTICISLDILLDANSATEKFVISHCFEELIPRTFEINQFNINFINDAESALIYLFR